MIETYNEWHPKKNRHFLGLLAGIGMGLVMGAILAGISIALKAEYTYLMLLGIALVGFIVSRFVPNKSVMVAITGGLLVP